MGGGDQPERLTANRLSGRKHEGDKYLKFCSNLNLKRGKNISFGLIIWDQF